MVCKRRDPVIVPYPRGFTLVELLVVIAIISMLMSVMLPSLIRAQKQGEQTHCLANHHQLMMGWIQYATDNDDRICDPNHLSLEHVLLPYVKGDGVFMCKGIEGEAKGVYGLSNTMAGQERDGVEPYIKWQNVRQPSGRLVFTDIEPRRQPWFWPVLREEDRWFWRPWSWPASSSLQGMTARHSGGTNRSFADGHAEYYRYHDVRTTQLIKGRIADANEASAENVDLTDMIRVLSRPEL